MRFFRNKYLVPVWTILRIWLGYQWIVPAIEKLKDPTWVGSQSGVAITGFLKGALAKATGDHPSVQLWYARFVESVALPNVGVFTYVVPAGELLVGISFNPWSFYYSRFDWWSIYEFKLLISRNY